jgi:hypothetical protein
MKSIFSASVILAILASIAFEPICLIVLWGADEAGKTIIDHNAATATLKKILGVIGFIKYESIVVTRRSLSDFVLVTLSLV